MKSSGIKTQNNQVMPTGSRLWTPANIGSDLKMWMRPEGVRPHNGESTSDTDTAQNKWFDSSHIGSVMGGPVDQAFSNIKGLVPTLVSAGNGMTFGTQNAKKFDVYRNTDAARGGSIPESSNSLIDPGTGAFTVLAVIGLGRSGSAEVPYTGSEVDIISDGTLAVASEYRLFIQVNSNTSFDPSFVKINSQMDGNTHTETLESKSGHAQLFDKEQFTIAYQRDGSGNSEFFEDGTSIGTATGQNKDLSDSNPRNIGCHIIASVSGVGNLYSSQISAHGFPEIIVYNKKDATTRILCEGYLAHKYGRQNELPSSHKYRYGPPRV